MTLYTVRVACEVAGHWRTPGVPFPLTDAQALLLAPPHGAVIAPYVQPPYAAKPFAAKPEPTNDRQHRHKRKNRRAA